MANIVKESKAKIFDFNNTYDLVVIEDYPEDARGHSCLIFGYGDGERAIHVVCSPKEDYLAIITAYLPDPEQWEDNLRKRKNK